MTTLDVHANIPASSKFRLKLDSRVLGPGKTRTHCGGNIVSCDVARPWQNEAALLRAARRTQRNFSEDFQEQFLCPGHKICVGHKCCARGKTRTRLGNMITRQQCCLHNVSSFCQPLTSIFSLKLEPFTNLAALVWIVTAAAEFVRALDALEMHATPFCQVVAELAVWAVC